MKWIFPFFMLLSGCGPKIPHVETCLFDQPRQTFHCVSAEGAPFDLAPSDPKSDKLVCLPFSDISIVLNYCNNLKKP